MKKGLRIMIGILLAASIQWISAYAVSPSETSSAPQELRFHFRFDRSLLDSAYRDNLQSIKELRRLFADPSSALLVDSISVSAASSMEGYGWYNERLTRKRAQAVKGYLTWKYPLLNQYLIYTHALGEDWQGLYELLLSSPETPDRNQILKMFETGSDKERIKNRLYILSQKGSDSHLQKEVLPLLRQAKVRIYWKDTTLYTDSATEEVAELLDLSSSAQESETVDHPSTPAESAEKSVAGPIPQPPASDSNVQPVQPIPAQKSAPARKSAVAKEHAERWAIKTNLLYWAALAPNLEAEMYINDRWSVNLEAQCAWWSQKKQNRYYQLLSGGPEVRFRFAGPNRFHGHYFGLYGSAGMYDLENRKTGYQGEFYSAGLTYGYLLPIGRSLGLEFGIGAGLVTSQYKTYIPQEGEYLYQQTKRMQYTGVTKAKVSLLWRFGKKGGRP